MKILTSGRGASYSEIMLPLHGRHEGLIPFASTNTQVSFSGKITASKAVDGSPILSTCAKTVSHDKACDLYVVNRLLTALRLWHGDANTRQTATGFTCDWYACHAHGFGGASGTIPLSRRVRGLRVNQPAPIIFLHTNTGGTMTLRQWFVHICQWLRSFPIGHEGHSWTTLVGCNVYECWCCDAEWVDSDEERECSRCAGKNDEPCPHRTEAFMMF